MANVPKVINPFDKVDKTSIHYSYRARTSGTPSIYDKVLIERSLMFDTHTHTDAQNTSFYTNASIEKCFLSVYIYIYI